MSTYSLPGHDERSRCHKPALVFLEKLGWTVLSPEAALSSRQGRFSEVILEDILEGWLRTHNRFFYKDKTYHFSIENIMSAIAALKDRGMQEGLLRGNEMMYDLLCLGKSFRESVDGQLKSFTLQYIDWDHPERNVFHVVEEFSVERVASRAQYRPDLVLFVNGIPLGVIECKAPGRKDPMGEAISQLLDYQKDDGIPHLFMTAQFLFALAENEACYGTVKSRREFWSQWRESTEETEKDLEALAQITVTREEVESILAAREKAGDAYGTLHFSVTEQHRLLYALCRPERFLELCQGFTLFDNGTKKVARYQQYFCVKKILARILKTDDTGRREGGVVWHTQGSGKSLTMVMLARALARSGIAEYKIVLVTDRIDLDDQLYHTFQHCGAELTKAGSGRDLQQWLVGHQQRIITTVIGKFETAMKRSGRNESPDIFVLVDEGHRGQYGSSHARMRTVLPNACFIGFTGTPVMKKDRDTVERFGGLIDSYTIDQAVEDRAVVPLLYEGRHVYQYVDEHGIDMWFDRETARLSDAQKADLKRKFSTTEQLNKAEQRIRAIAWDVGEHFEKSCYGKDIKGQLVAQDKATALLFKRYLDEFGKVTSEVLISAPDEREGEEEAGLDKKKQEIHRFWKEILGRFGNEERYNKQLINAFKFDDDPEIIIVVDKLLTGFDAPRNTVLYLTRLLKDHTLLQAIARVNRLHEGKDFGYIIDYRGVLSNLNEALDLYSKLAEYDSGDLASTLMDMREEINTLAQKHGALKNIFAQLPNKRDREAYERLLADEELRHQFYEKLSRFSRTLAICLSSASFYEDTPQETIDMYQRELKFFMSLRSAVRRRYAEDIDFGAYEAQIQKLLDTHVQAGEVESVTPLVNIFDEDAFQKEIEKVSGAAAQADTIAHRISRTIRDRMKEDPVFYRKYSELIQETIRQFKENRIKDNHYLAEMKRIMTAVISRKDDSTPTALADKAVAAAYYGSLQEILVSINPACGELKDEVVTLTLRIETCIEEERQVDWIHNQDVQNKMKQRIDDCLFDFAEETRIPLDTGDMDVIIDRILSIAKVRRAN